MFLLRLRAAIIVAVVLAAFLTALGFAIYFAHQEEEKTPEVTPQASPATRGVTTYGYYVAQEGDSCWTIGEKFTGVGSQGNVRLFADLNSLSLPDCKIQAGTAYVNPWQTVTVQTVKTDDDWPYWRGSVAMALVVGLTLGLAAPSSLRLFRRRKQYTELPSNWEPQ